MPVPASINDLSTAAGSNSPAGTETPTEGDNYIRSLSAFIAQQRDLLNGTTSGASLNAPILASPALSGTATGNVTWPGTHTFSAAATVMTFGGTFGNVARAGATVLDWYEEVSFTPTIVGSSTAGTGTYSIQVGRATRKGDHVDIEIAISWSAHTGTGNVQIGLGAYAFFPSGANNRVIGVDLSNDLFKSLQVGTASPWFVTSPNGSGTALAASGALKFNGVIFL